jgi:hypothetical protein
MIHTCRECNSPCGKIFSLVDTLWCPISLEILERNWRLICEQCYRAWQGSMVDYAKQQLTKVTDKVGEAEHDMAHNGISTS